MVYQESLLSYTQRLEISYFSSFDLLKPSSPANHEYIISVQKNELAVGKL